MDETEDCETRNIHYLLAGTHIKLTEELWCKHFDLTTAGPYSREQENHQLLKAAYQQIKVLGKLHSEAQRKVNWLTKQNNHYKADIQVLENKLNGQSAPGQSSDLSDNTDG